MLLGVSRCYTIIRQLAPSLVVTWLCSGVFIEREIDWRRITLFFLRDKFLAYNLFSWRHFYAISALLFNRFSLLAFKICSFSSRQRLHRADPAMYGGVRGKTDSYIYIYITKNHTKCAIIQLLKFIEKDEDNYVFVLKIWLVWICSSHPN